MISCTGIIELEVFDYAGIYVLILGTQILIPILAEMSHEDSMRICIYYINSVAV